MFDKEKALLGKWTSRSGIIFDDDNYFMTGLLRVKVGEHYSSSAANYFGVDTAVFYDESGNFVASGHDTTTYDDPGVSFSIARITVPDDSRIAYMRCNYRVSRINTCMVVKGNEFPDEYVPYTPPSAKLNNEVHLNEYHLMQIHGAISEDAKKINNPLWGKKAAFNGDSICYGLGAAGGYAKIISDRNNMVFENRAVSGGTIAAETYNSSGVAKHWICRDIANMAADADYIILEGGVNDGEAMGTLSRAYNTSGFNDAEFTGAFESMIVQALMKWRGKKIGYIAVHGCYRLWSNVRAKLNSDAEGSYYQRAIDICEKWGIPVCDLNISVPPFGLLPTDDPLRTQYTNNGDGWHPNPDGYRQFYCDKIEAWMKTL